MNQIEEYLAANGTGSPFRPSTGRWTAGRALSVRTESEERVSAGVVGGLSPRAVEIVEKRIGRANQKSWPLGRIIEQPFETNANDSHLYPVRAKFVSWSAYRGESLSESNFRACDPL